MAGNGLPTLATRTLVFFLRTNISVDKKPVQPEHGAFRKELPALPG
jgi:hypothetical protein